MDDQTGQGFGSESQLPPTPRIQIVADEGARPRIGALAGHYLGDYQLRELLAVGGMAEVYKANDPTLQREVAVKVLIGPAFDESTDDKTYSARFRAEARRVAAFTHPHIVPVYNAGEIEVNGRVLPYLVMPLLHESLREVMKRRGEIPSTDAVNVTVQVAEGLDAAHRRGFVHRDVKPENILIDADGQVLLADFGIAREVASLSQRDRIATPEGKVLGTPEYMAPEQLSRGEIDSRTDIYGLGVVLYEMLTSRLPFAGETPYEYAYHALNDAPIPPSVFEQDVSPELEQAILTVLAREPEKRYPNVLAFADALREALAPATSQSQPDLPVAGALDARKQAISRAQTLSTPVASQAQSRDMSIAKRRVYSSPWIFTAAAILVLACTIVLLPFLQHPNGSNGMLAGNLPGFGREDPTAQPTSTASATATAQATAQPHQSTPHVGGGAPGSGPTTSPMPTETPTVIVSPTATPVPVTPGTALTFTPSSLTLSRTSGNTCSATQIITNVTGQTVGWYWQGPKVAGFHFAVNGGPTMNWPSTTTNIPAGGQSTLVATTTCQHTGTYTIVVRDSLGGVYSFSMSVA